MELKCIQFAVCFCRKMNAFEAVALSTLILVGKSESEQLQPFLFKWKAIGLKASTIMLLINEYLF